MNVFGSIVNISYHLSLISSDNKLHQHSINMTEDVVAAEETVNGHIQSSNSHAKSQEFEVR